MNPGFETSTAWVYKNLNFGLTKKGDCTNIAGLKVSQIARSLHNDLETVTAAAHPVIAEMERSLIDSGALGACMSGSGPTVFGMYPAEAACRAAALALHTKGWHLYPAEILTGSPYTEYLESAP